MSSRSPLECPLSLSRLHSIPSQLHIFLSVRTYSYSLNRSYSNLTLGFPTPSSEPQCRCSLPLLQLACLTFNHRASPQLHEAIEPTSLARQGAPLPPLYQDSVWAAASPGHISLPHPCPCWERNSREVESFAYDHMANKE